MKRNPVDQAAPHPFQSFSLEEYHPPPPLELPTEPIGKPETGKEDGRTGHHGIQTVNQTSRIDNKVNLQQYPSDWTVLKNPQLLPCPQDYVWQGNSMND